MTGTVQVLRNGPGLEFSCPFSIFQSESQFIGNAAGLPPFVIPANTAIRRRIFCSFISSVRKTPGFPFLGRAGMTGRTLFGRCRICLNKEI